MSFIGGDLIYSYEIDHDENGNEILKHEIKAKVIGLDGKGQPLINILSGEEYMGAGDRGRRFVRVGNTFMPARQNGIYYDAITEDNPRIVIYEGIDRFGKLFAHPTNPNKMFIDSNLIRAQVGNLGSINDSDFGGWLTTDQTESGNPLFGLYSDNVFLKGKIIIANPDDINVSEITNDSQLIKTYYQSLEPTGGTYVVGDMWVDTDDNNHLHRWNGTTWESVRGEIANWNHLGNIPSPLSTPAGDGIYVSGTHMGYYAGGQWKTYIQNNGYFYFDGNGTNFISWNGSVLDIRGKLNADDITSGTLTGRTIRTSVSNPRVEIDSASNSMKVYDNLGIIKTAVGDLSTITDPEFGALTGLYGLYSDSIFLNFSQQGKFLVKKDDNNFFSFDPTNFQFKSENFSLKSQNLGIYSGANAKILIGDSIDYNLAKIGFKNDGSGKLADNNINWDISGQTNFGNNITISGDITLGLDGIIRTDRAGELGVSGIKISANGIEGFNALDRTFYLPTNPSQKPEFFNGIIREVEFEIYTSGIIRTSANVGDGDSGLFLNKSGLYAFAENKLASNDEASVKIKNDGTFRFGEKTNQNIQWNGSSLNVTGTINILNKSDIGTTEITDDANHADKAKWTSITVPTTPSKMQSDSGLHLDGTHLGYYLGTGWVTYMDNSGNFACGSNRDQGIEWNQTSGILTIKGSLNIVNPSTAFNGGELSTNDINNVEGWTAGANWTTNLSNIPIRFKDSPTGQGLFVTGNAFGFYDSITHPSKPWRTYMDNSGNFYLSGTNASLSWNSTSDTLSIEGGTFNGGTITGGTFQTSENGQRIIISNDEIDIRDSSSYSVKLKGDGNTARFYGHVWANSYTSQGYLTIIDIDDNFIDLSMSLDKKKLRLTNNAQVVNDVGLGIEFSNQADLYISQANTLRTDGNLDVGGIFNAAFLRTDGWLYVGGDLTVNGNLSVTGNYGLSTSDIPSNIAATKIGNGSVNNTEFDYLNGVTSNIQSQLDNLFITENRTWTTSSPSVSISNAKIRTVVKASLIYTGGASIDNISAGILGQELIIIRINSGINVLFSEIGNLKLNGNFTMTQWDTLSLVYDGTSWIETSRSTN